jgi:pimeloyl-ACP methyl ester carboxylesterase
MTPIVFDGCFGWLHPAGGARGVVLCNPHGYEELCVHRIWRGLAEQLAAAGLPTLRFDYPGTGDSAGDDEEPGRVQAWLTGIQSAVKWMRSQLEVKEVALVGMRLGATLAATAAQHLEGVDALALLAPLVTGKAYARELKALTMLAPPLDGAPVPRPEWKNDLESAGFVLTADTLAGLNKLDLLKLERRPASRILILNRTEAPVDARLAARLQTLGAAVREDRFDGYAQLMRDAHFAQVPTQAFATLSSWLTEAVPAPTLHRTPPTNAELSLPGVVEDPVFFGKGLFGVRCSPQTPALARPAILFLNTGSNHHIGSNRMSVTLGRRLAEQGLVSLRFDLAGIGDSAAWPGGAENRLYSKDSCADVRAALDWLENEGHRECVVIGLCSGAYLGFHTAIEDPRIVGQVLINAQRFTWHEGDSLEIAMRKSFKSTRFYLQTVLKPQTWQRAFSGEVNLGGIGRTLLERGIKRARARVEGLKGRLLGVDRDASDVARGFYLLSDRGVDTLLVYSAQDGGMDELDTHLGPGGRKLAGRENVKIEIFEGADHTFTARWARERFARSLEEYLARE